MEWFAILIILLLIAFFSGIEIAFVSANKLRIELLKEKGKSAATIIAKFNRQPAKFISTLLIGLNICVVAFGSISADIMKPERFGLQPIGEIPLLIIQTVTTTFIILFFGELIPKILFRVNSDATLLLFAYPIKAVYIVLKPITNLFHWMSRGLIRVVFGSSYVESMTEFTEEDLEYLVKETAAGEIKEDGEEHDELNSEMFEKALYLKDVKVRNCMVPRLEIVAVDIEDGIEAVRKTIVDSKHSRLFVYQESIDKIIGYIHHFDLLKNPLTIHEILREPVVVPETMNARDLLATFTKEKKNFAWVVDEYGGTAGIVTLEDVMEEIFGEIEDEHDDDALTEKKINDNTYLFSSRLEIDYLNEEYNLEIPEGEYETLGGYIVQIHEDIPEQGEIINLDQWQAKIIKANDKRIELVELSRLPAATQLAD